MNPKARTRRQWGVEPGTLVSSLLLLKEVDRNLSEVIQISV